MSLLYVTRVWDSRLESILCELEELREWLRDLEISEVLRSIYLDEISELEQYITSLLRDDSLNEYILEDEIIELSKRILSLREELISYRQL